MLASRPSIKGGARPRIDEASHSNIVPLSNTVTRSSISATTNQHTNTAIMQYVVHASTGGLQCTHRLLEPRFSANYLAMVLATAITTTMAAPTNNLAVSVSPKHKATPLQSHPSNPPPAPPRRRRNPLQSRSRSLALLRRRRPRPSPHRQHQRSNLLLRRQQQPSLLQHRRQREQLQWCYQHRVGSGLPHPRRCHVPHRV